MNTRSLNLDQTVAMLLTVADRVVENESLLSEADRNIGDGDHGLAMKRGMAAAKEKLSAGGFSSIDEPFTAVGTAMMGSMGGASGAIFGTLFRDGGKALAGRSNFESTDVFAFLQAALEGVQNRGKAAPGDKTVVDALAPAAARASDAQGATLEEALRAAAEAAETGVEQTKPLTAKFGRAKALGEAAVGHADPGALSLGVILRAMCDYVSQFD